MWSRIRAVGELTVLTRASYSMIILVAIIAGGWRWIHAKRDMLHVKYWGTATRNIQLSIDAIESIVSESKGALAADDQFRIELRARLKRIHNAIVEREQKSQFQISGSQLDSNQQWLDIRKRLERLVAEFEAEPRRDATARDHKVEEPEDVEATSPEPLVLLRERTINLLDNLESSIKLLSENPAPPKLHPIWACSFFGALLIVLGHLIYESKAPEVVRRYSKREFAEHEVREYTVSPSQTKLQRASALIGSIEAFDDIRSYLESTSGVLSGKHEPHEVTQLNNNTMIELCARVEYRMNATQNPLWAWISLSFYFIGLVIIFGVIIRQIWSVIDATFFMTGWNY